MRDFSDGRKIIDWLAWLIELEGVDYGVMKMFGAREAHAFEAFIVFNYIDGTLVASAMSAFTGREMRL